MIKVHLKTLDEVASCTVPEPPRADRPRRFRRRQMREEQSRATRLTGYPSVTAQIAVSLAARKCSQAGRGLSSVRDQFRDKNIETGTSSPSLLR